MIKSETKAIYREIGTESLCGFMQKYEAKSRNF